MIAGYKAISETVQHSSLYRLISSFGNSPQPAQKACLGTRSRQSCLLTSTPVRMDISTLASSCQPCAELETRVRLSLEPCRAAYTALGPATFIDWLMGELLEAVERTNHKRDTAVFLLSDHGDYAGDYGLVEKWPSGLEDVLTHVPLIASVPGGTQGNSSENMVELFDVMATCLDLAGTQARHTHFARSLMPQIHGGPGDPKRAAFAEGGYNQYEPQCFEDNASLGSLYYPKENLQVKHPETISRAAMVRTHDYKLVSRPQGQSELYFYKDDPQELHNRFGDRDVAGIQCELQQQLLHWYVNTTGIAPFDKDQRGFPPFYPTPTLPLSIGSAVREIVDQG